MKRFLVSTDANVRSEFVASVGGRKVVVYGDSEPVGFDKSYSLQSLYDDATFFDAMAGVDGECTLFLWDVGPWVHSETAAYLKSYTKLKPLSLQAGDVRVVDRLAFYYSAKSIMRPFLYLHEQVFHETLHEFYGIGVYSDYEDNTVERSADRMREHVMMDRDELRINVVDVRPTAEESAEYERLKYRLIMEERRSKSSVVNSLFKFIDAMTSKREAIERCSVAGVKIVSNDFRKLLKTYSDVAGSNDESVFFSTGFGLDTMGLDRTLRALLDHNELVRRLRG